MLATLQPRSSSVAQQLRCYVLEHGISTVTSTHASTHAGIAGVGRCYVLEHGISTVTSTHASTHAVRECRHPHMPHPNACSDNPRLLAPYRQRPRPAAPRGLTAGTSSERTLPAEDAHLTPQRAAASGAGSHDLHRACRAGAHRAGPCSAARAGGGHLHGAAAKWPRARPAIYGSRSKTRGGQKYLAQGTTLEVVAAVASCSRCSRYMARATTPFLLRLRATTGGYWVERGCMSPGVEV